MRSVRFLCVAFLLISSLTWGCEGCEIQEASTTLKVPFADNFDRPSLGAMWSSEMAGRWRIQFDERTKQGRLCVEQARNNPLFLRGTLPRDVVVEFDAYAQEKDGDVKIELFTDGRFHATGYVLAHGGWHNAMSIIDRLGEHNRDCSAKEQNARANCRRWTRREKVIIGKGHHWKVIRHGEKLLWYLDGKLFMRYDDPQPLEGKGHQFFAFSNWIAHVCFDNLTIRPYTPETAQKEAPAPSPARVLVTPSPTPVPSTPSDPASSDPAPSDPAPAFVAPSAVRSGAVLVPAQPQIRVQSNPQPLRLHNADRFRHLGIQRLQTPLQARPALQDRKSVV